VIVPQTVLAQAAPVTQSTKVVDLAAIQVAYKLSSHSNNYGEARGPNTYCARCHSPRNWNPQAIPGPAPNCMACKFPFDKEIRKPPANTNVLIEQKDWKNIGCDICHEVDAKGVVDPKPAAWNQATGKYEAVADNTELCDKCHADSIGGSKHKVTVGGSAHTTEIGLVSKRPHQCTDCHNPHSQKANCTGCHPALSKSVGHDAAHAKVACSACHDASGLVLGPTADNTQWVAFTMVSSPSGGPPTKTQVTSHILQKSVDCARCHYDNNPNKLRSLVTPTATRPPAPSATAATPTVLPK